MAEYGKSRTDDDRDVGTVTVERMCRELALEICGAVADVLAERPTKEKLAFEKQEWLKRAGPRRLAMCRQALDDLVREVAREEAREKAKKTKTLKKLKRQISTEDQGVVASM